MTRDDKVAQRIGAWYAPPRSHWMKHAAAVATVLCGSIACGVPHPPGLPSIPEPSKDVAVYDTEARFDLEAAALRVRSVVRFPTDERTAASYSFRLSPTLQVHSVQGTGVSGYRMVPHEFRNEFIVELDDALSAGSLVTLDVEYSGSPSLWESMINEISPDWVQLSMDAGWHPEISHLRFVTGVLRLHLPSDWQVIGSGHTSVENGIHVMRNDIRQPDVSFAAGPGLERIETDDFTIYHRNAQGQAVPVVLQAAGACGSYLNQRYGSVESMPHVRLVLGPRNRAAFARKNFIPLGPIEPDADPVGLHRFLCHELAHFWASPVGGDPADHWMSEAFAEYVAGRSLREHFGAEVFARWIEGKEERGRDHGPVWTPDLTRRVPDPAMYDRAPYLLWRLEQRIGRESFEALVRRYMTERIGRTEALLGTLEAVSDAATVAWFREQLASIGTFSE